MSCINSNTINTFLIYLPYTMQYLFDFWNTILSRIKSAQHVLLLLDYDGTLTPIIDKPENAYLTPDNYELIRRLSKNKRFTIGIISGRALNDLKRRINISGVVYAGNHGLEIEGIKDNFLDPVAEELRPIFQIMARVMMNTIKVSREQR